MRKLVAVFVLLGLVASAAPAAAETTTAAQQLEWVMEVSHQLPVAEAEQREHLSAAAMDAIGGPDKFNQIMASLGPMTRTATLSSTAVSVQAVASDRLLVDLHVDASGLIDGLHIRPYAPSPASWPELDSRLGALAPNVSFAAAVLDDTCRPVHEVRANTPRPLGSAFKLYVLGALERRTADWSKTLPVREDWKSLPTGVLQDQPAGTNITLREYANLMISISDNTATDHLIHYLGRDAVQRQFRAFGNHSTEPLLTTREFFALKGFQYPTQANAYLSLPHALRPAMLPALAAVPRSAIQSWTEPRNIDTIEWFGSANDMCRAYAGLTNQHSPRIAEALSLQDGGIGLDRTEYPTVWFKGGSEPGVLTLAYLARTADGRTAVATVMLSNPSGGAIATTEALALARGGIELATM